MDLAIVEAGPLPEESKYFLVSLNELVRFHSWLTLIRPNTAAAYLRSNTAVHSATP